MKRKTNVKPHIRKKGKKLIKVKQHKRTVKKNRSARWCPHCRNPYGNCPVCETREEPATYPWKDMTKNQAASIDIVTNYVPQQKIFPIPHTKWKETRYPQRVKVEAGLGDVVSLIGLLGATPGPIKKNEKKN